jgi:uncharacterized protein DUF3465
MKGSRGALALAAIAALAIGAFACGGREAADDQGLHQAIVNGTSGAEVTFDATLLADPVESGGHERFEVKATTGETLEVDHNTSLAPSVPIHAGDAVIIHGQLYIDPGPRLGVHCTHAHTSSGCPSPGWVEYANNYYE